MAKRRIERTARRAAYVAILSMFLAVGSVLAASDASPKDAEFYKLQWNLKAV